MERRRGADEKIEMSIGASAPSRHGKGPCRSPLQRAYVAVAAEKQADGHAREGEDQKQQRRARAAAEAHGWQTQELL